MKKGLGNRVARYEYRDGGRIYSSVGGRRRGSGWGIKGGEK